MIDPQATANRIASARREKGFTQEELSVRLGVTAQAISKWERGLSLPDVEMLLELSRKLGVTMEYLLDAGIDPPQEFQSVYDGAPSSLLAKFKQTPIVLILGKGLERFITKDFAANCLPLILNIRENIFRDTGVLLPAIRLMDDYQAVETAAYSLRFFGREAALQTVGEEEAFADIAAGAEKVIRENLKLFVNRHMVKLLVEDMRASFPFCVEGVVPERVGLTRLKRICKALVEDGRSIRDFYAIVEALDDALDMGGDEEWLIEAVKKAIER